MFLNVIHILETNVYFKAEYYKDLFSFQHKNIKVNPFVHSSSHKNVILCFIPLFLFLKEHIKHYQIDYIISFHSIIEWPSFITIVLTYH